MSSLAVASATASCSSDSRASALAHRLRRAIGRDTGASARLVHEVDGLIGQEAILDIAARKTRGGFDCGRRVRHMMMLCIARAQRLEDLTVSSTLGSSTSIAWKRRSNAGSFCKCLRNSSAVVAPMIGRTARQHRLEHGARVDRALGGTGADERVHLVDEQDDVIGLGGLAYHVLQALLELAAVLRPRDQAGKIQRPTRAAPSGSRARCPRRSPGRDPPRSPSCPLRGLPG